MPYDKASLNERIAKTIDDFVALGYDGCITGSCVLPNDFSQWESEPDVDFFAYSKDSWTYAVSSILSPFQDRYKVGSKKDAWKLDRLSKGKSNSPNKWITQTAYLLDTETGVYINMSYKPGSSNILDVLGRFDTIAIMVGICCRTKKKVDLRHAFFDKEHPFPTEFDGNANPIRLWYMTEGWDEGTWARELSRIKKYDTRGFNMQGMASELLDVAGRVLNRGEVIGSEKSRARYLNLMLSCYRPVVWLENFISPDNEEGYDILSDEIFDEIKKNIKDLPEEVRVSILNDLAEPLSIDVDKEFHPDEEEEADLNEIPEDR